MDSLLSRIIAVTTAAAAAITGCPATTSAPKQKVSIWPTQLVMLKSCCCRFLIKSPVMPASPTIISNIAGIQSPNSRLS